MDVPVLWVSRHDGIAARGYADQALLETIIDRTAWRPPGAIAFHHQEVRGDFPAVDGALVIIEGRHHASDADVSWLVGQLDRLAWAVIIVTGDEESEFPHTRLAGERRRVWIMDPRPQHADVAYTIPGGWYWNTHEHLAAAEALAEERPLDWFFAGQITHERRFQAVEVLRGMAGGRLIETAGFLQGVAADEYARLLASAKVVPCPSGPESCDTARPLAAMEAGAVPVVDLRKPKDPQFDYWTLVFGAGHPLRGVEHWGDFPAVTADILNRWPAESNRVSAWWQQWKRSTSHRLDADLRAVARVELRPIDPADAVTVLITTSPITRHPDTSHLEEVVASVRAQLPDAEVIIVADGVRPEQEHLRAGYDEYLRRVCWLANFHWHNVVPFIAPAWGHQANAVRAALDLVATPQVVFAEHDTPIVGDVPWPALCHLVRDGVADAVRLHTDDAIHPEHEYLFLDPEPVELATPWGPVPARRAAQWWQRPHLASTAWYRRMLAEHFTTESRTMIEDRYYGVLYTAWVDEGEAGWDRTCRLVVYTPPGSMLRSRHLDSREGAPKFDMKYQ